MHRTKIKALVIEDNKIIEKVTRTFLEEFGYEVEVANNGEEGLCPLKNGDYQVALIDIGLPDISGFEVINQFRCYNKKTKVIIQSAHLDEKLIKECFSAGCSAVLSKPLTVEVLKAHL